MPCRRLAAGARAVRFVDDLQPALLRRLDARARGPGRRARGSDAVGLTRTHGRPIVCPTVSDTTRVCPTLAVDTVDDPAVCVCAALCGLGCRTRRLTSTAVVPACLTAAPPDPARPRRSAAGATRNASSVSSESDAGWAVGRHWGFIRVGAQPGLLRTGLGAQTPRSHGPTRVFTRGPGRPDAGRVRPRGSSRVLRTAIPRAALGAAGQMRGCSAPRQAPAFP